MAYPEDRFTNTVAGAAAYEEHRARMSGEYDDYGDDDVDYDIYDDIDSDDEIEDEDEGPCCNDFSCPCGG